MTVSTHVLDTARGRPAADVAVRLERLADGDWKPLAEGRTNADGRIADWSAGTEAGTEAGSYRLVFDTAGYFGPGAFFPEVAVVFRIADATQHHHVPLLLSPYSYSTYRGS